MTAWALVACADLPPRPVDPPVSGVFFAAAEEEDIGALVAEPPRLIVSPLVAGTVVEIRIVGAEDGADVRLTWGIWDAELAGNFPAASLTRVLAQGTAAGGIVAVDWLFPADAPHDTWGVFHAEIDGVDLDPVARRSVRSWPIQGPAPVEPWTSPDEAIGPGTVHDLWSGVARTLHFDALGGDTVDIERLGAGSLLAFGPNGAALPVDVAAEAQQVSWWTPIAATVQITLPASEDEPFALAVYDEPAATPTEWARDDDGDGVPSDSAAISARRGPIGHFPVGQDCDDGRADVHPEAFDACDDLVDQDCDGADRPCHPDLDGALLASEAFAATLALPGLVEPRLAAGAVGDLDGDGVLDLGVADGSHVAVFASARDQVALSEAVVAVSTSGDHLGLPADRPGDLDRDGVDDLVALDPTWEGAGAVFVWHGPVPAITTPEAATATLLGPADGSAFGTGLAAGTDLTGDDSPDLAVVAPWGTENGLVSVYERVTADAPPVAVATVEGQPGLGRPDRRLDSRADANADGLRDLVVSGSVKGRAWLFVSPLAAAATVAEAVATVEARDDLIGEVTGTAGGDLDGDGAGDLAFAALDAPVGTPAKVGILPGGTAGNWALGDLTARVDGPLDAEVLSFDAAGDLDGDGFGDLALGSPSDPAGDVGRVRIYLGPVEGHRNAVDANAWIDGGHAGGLVVGIEDHDGDGVDDLAVGMEDGLGILWGGAF